MISVARSLLVRLAGLVTIPVAFVAVAGPAHAGCAVTGHIADPPADAAAVRGAVAATPAHQLDGVALDRPGGWVVPAGSEPILVVDSTGQPIGDLSATASRYGVSRSVDLEFQPVAGLPDTAGDRLVSTGAVPGPGASTRTVQLRLDRDGCSRELTIAADRSALSTVAGLAGLAAAALFGALAVLLARRRAGGWVRRFLVAAPFGLLAGAGEAVLLYEAGVFGPASRAGWWLPVAGVALAAALPWTRRRSRRTRAPAAPPIPPAVGRWQPVSLFTRTGAFEIWRAVAGDPARPALVKVAQAQRRGEPAVQQLLEREATVLAQLDHPHCVRLVEALTGDPSPVLVLDQPAGATLRAFITDRGPLAGPQAVAVVLDLLAGLGAVHDLGLVHRNVRPECVWLDGSGQARLAGFELACPGVEHAIAAAGEPPYASPEQLRGEALDARSDLWSCGAVLAELLTAQVPGPAGQPSELDGVPARLWPVVAGALAPAPADRPDSAAQLADQLRAAAEDAYGSGWADRAALGAAVASHGAIGSAAAGYAAAGGGGAVAGAAGAGSGLGTAGGGPAAIAALGAAGRESIGGASAAAATAPPGSAVAGASAGKAGAVVGPVAAAAVVAVAGLVAAIADPRPAEAATEVVTPEAAEVIFVRTMAEAGADDYQHLTGEAAEQVRELWVYDEALRQGELVEIVVGVPAGQYAYPAWFSVWAELRAGETVVYLFGRFDRPAAAEPWRATVMNWSAYPVVAPPVLDVDGWLATPDPATGSPDEDEPALEDLELVVDPAELPQRYVDWFTRSETADELADDELLELAPHLAAHGTSGVAAAGPRSTLVTWSVLHGDETRSPSTGEVIGSRTIEVVADPAEPTVRWRDGEAVVSFTVVVHYTGFNGPGFTSRACGPVLVHPDLDGRYRQIAQETRLPVEAVVPVRRPWQGRSDAELPVVQIDDDIHRGEEVMIPERSVPC